MKQIRNITNKRVLTNRVGMNIPLSGLAVLGRGARMASEAGRWCTVPWARKGRAGELGNKPVGRLDGWVRWTGCSAVCEAAGLCVAEGTWSRPKPPA